MVFLEGVFVDDLGVCNLGVLGVAMSLGMTDVLRRCGSGVEHIIKVIQAIRKDSDQS